MRLAVQDQAALSGELSVDPDGHVLVPLVGLVPVAGRDFAEAAADIRALLGAELPAGADVQLVPLFRVTVLGEVAAPGVVAVDPTLSLADVMALAGGFGPEADRDRIVLVRGGEVALEMDAEGLVRTDVPLRSGDRVLVAREGLLRRHLGLVLGTAGSLVVALITALAVR